MNRIRLLPEQVANQIAAGEVVERPASVVKELVENALDAGSTRVMVEIGAGGRSLIRVTDDGCGMSRDDALLSLERHATSKIRRAEDLQAITTMGFRGEAVPSIASVSRFTLTTRPRDGAGTEATQVVVNGGRMVEVKVASSPPGTSVEVRQLFFNLPARRKFLRTENTERAHIQHYLILAALAHPEVGFTLVNDGKVSWQLTPVRWESVGERFDALRERLRQLHGAEIPLVAVDMAAEIEEVRRPDLEQGIEAQEAAASRFRVWGFIGAPGVSRSTREDQHLFVNRRPVENRGLNHALLEGYHTALMRGRYPVCCLFLEIDPVAVDVNIHPAKREVKFREEQVVRRLVARAVREALLAYAHPVDGPNEGPTESPTGPGLPAATAGRVAPFFGRPGGKGGTPVGEARLRLESPDPALAVPEQRSLGLGLNPGRGGQQVPESNGGSEPDGSHTAQVTPSHAEELGEPPPKTLAAAFIPTAPVPLLEVPMRVVGVLGRLYVVLESDRGLVLMDQHAAHERILFEQMLRRLEKGEAAPSQRLLLPETVELSPRDAEFLRTQIETLGRLGVGLSEFGDRTFLLDGLPPFARAKEPRAFVVELVDSLRAAGGGVNTARLGEDVVAKTVCRHAIKANDPMRGPELERLVEDLRGCAMPYTCPHGRPTLIELGWRELEKKFGRTG